MPYLEYAAHRSGNVGIMTWAETCFAVTMNDVILCQE